jgi:ribonuclease HII
MDSNHNAKPTPSTNLRSCKNADENIYEIGVDESGRGPMFGRVYAAAVILPKDDSDSSLFDFSKIKDSKKFHSKKKIEDVAEYIKSHALAWHVSYETEQTIDETNILQATQRAMHAAIRETRVSFLRNKTTVTKEPALFHLLIDGNYFQSFTYLNKQTYKIESIPHDTVVSGDDTYASIAAASILAKVERDKYIMELCRVNPHLSEHYGIDRNMGYGTKKHLDGIKAHGITQWHRRSFGICKNYSAY